MVISAGSAPGVDVTFDQAAGYCKNKGAGWLLLSNAEWAAVALWSRKNGTIPGGDNQGGCDVDHHHESGVGASWCGPMTRTGEVSVIGRVVENIIVWEEP